MFFFLNFRDAGAEQKFKDISNAYEVSWTGQNLKVPSIYVFVVESAHFYQIT
jgi:hypothetical protein